MEIAAVFEQTKMMIVRRRKRRRLMKKRYKVLECSYPTGL